MQVSSRLARSRSAPLFFDSRRPASNFAFIDRNFRGLSTLSQILSQIRLCQGSTIVIESDLEPSIEIQEENKELSRKYGLKSSKLYRLSFFSVVLRSASLRKCSPDDFLGYAIIKVDNFGKRLQQQRVFESVIRPPIHPSIYIRGSQKWEVQVCNTTFAVHGYIYAQQNAKTNCCAHVAIRTALGRFVQGEEVRYAQMNSFLKLSEPSQGLEAQEIVKLFKNSDVSCSLIDFTQTDKESFSGFLPPSFVRVVYGSIESGFPAIIFFGSSVPGYYHVVPVFGHTFCRNTWVPNAESLYFSLPDAKYLPSDAWMDHMIAHDDNHGSYQSIPRHFMSNARQLPPPSNKNAKQSGDDYTGVAYVIGTLPKKVAVTSIEAELIAAEYILTLLAAVQKDKSPMMRNIRSNYPWYSRSLKFNKDRHLVLRPILVKADEYLDHLEKVSDWYNMQIPIEHISELRSLLLERGNYLWMIEISIPELFATNHRKIGEILIRSDKKVTTHRDLNAFIFARLAGFYALLFSDNPEHPEFQFIPNDVQTHVELYGCETRGHIWSQVQSPLAK